MKNLYYLLACLFFIAACSKDNGTGDIETFVPSDVYFVDTLYNELENTGKVEIGIKVFAEMNVVAVVEIDRPLQVGAGRAAGQQYV